jgi:hypothetical protein
MWLERRTTSIVTRLMVITMGTIMDMCTVGNITSTTTKTVAKVPSRSQ